VHPKGFEPLPSEPESEILSIILRVLHLLSKDFSLLRSKPTNKIMNFKLVKLQKQKLLNNRRSLYAPIIQQLEFL
jgi:hypothetical protein